MRANLIQYTWKGNSGYSYAYVMITDHYAIEDIKKDKRPKVLWGGTPDSFAVSCALKNAGIDIDFVCDVREPGNVHSPYMELRDFREILNHADEYFFIISVNDAFERMDTIKRLQFRGVDEMGIVFSGFSKDFGGRKSLQDACYASVNEAFAGINLINKWNDLENCRRSILEGFGYWDVLYMLIYSQYKKRQGTTYLEVGPGLGVMSLSLKKLIDLDVTWLCIPNEESLWSEWRRASFRKILTKYDIHIKEGFIETDAFEGSYDVIVMAQVMEHLIFNPVNTLKKLASMLSDDGRLFIAVPEEVVHHNVESYQEMPYPEDLDAAERQRRTEINAFGHFHEYSREEAMEAFEESGLECVAYAQAGPIHNFELKRA